MTEHFEAVHRRRMEKSLALSEEFLPAKFEEVERNLSRFPLDFYSACKD